VYHVRMKSVQFLIVFGIIGVSLLFPSSFVQGQERVELTAQETHSFQTLGYVVRKHLPSEVSSRIIYGNVYPLHAQLGQEVAVEAHNEMHGRIIIQSRQVKPIQSIDGQRILDITCCLNLYSEELKAHSLNFNDGLKKKFELPKIDVAEKDGTFNTLIDLFIFPSY